MAQFKDLIVSGSSRFIGKTYGSTFVGYLDGNSEKATIAYKDKNGKDITEYISNLSINNNIITYTDGGGNKKTLTVHDTTYSQATNSNLGLVKLYGASGTNTDGTMTQKAISSALDNKVDKNTPVDSAISDSDNQQINTTYIKDASVSGKKVTFTKGDGSTFSIETQDNNTTYGTGTTAVAGLTKLYTTTGSNTDGTMTQGAIKSQLDGKLNSTATAVAANKDNKDQVIDSTYIKNASVNGTLVTFTRGDGSTFTITTKDTNDNTTYATGTSTTAGLTKLYNSVGSNTDGTINQNALKNIFDTKLNSTATAVAANKDNKDQVIDSTYIKSASVSGKVVTFTKGDGSTFNITTQDNNTTYGTGTTAVAGLTKLYTSTGSNTDGTMTRKAISDAISSAYNDLNTKIGNINSFEVVVCTSASDLPTTGASHTIYFVPEESSGSNRYVEYLWIESDSMYEEIGFTDVDLSGYYTSTQTDTAITNATDNNIVNATVSGRVVTFTKKNGSTFSITTQDTDNNTTYATGTSTSSGLTKLYTSTGSNTDGTIRQKELTDLLNAGIVNASVSGRTVTFTKKDGSTFSISTQDSNTTYATGTTAVAGLTKLYTGTGSNTDGTMTQSAITSAISNGAVASATKDSGGNTINTTYIKNAEVSGKVVTFTKGDGSTFSITTQDNNTTYGTGTTAATGLAKLYSTTGTNTDGTIRQSELSTLINSKLNADATAVAATKATNDSANQQINTTYIKNATVAGKVVTFTKGDGSTFSITTQDTDNNTTYAVGTTAVAGLTKLYTGTGSNTDGTMTQAAIKSQLDGKLSTSGTAAAATKDSGGNTINTTYIKNASVSGKTVTFTKGDNSTFTISTQDSNTTYATGTTAATGLTKLYAATGTNTDGTIRQKELSTLINSKLDSTATAAAANKDNKDQVIDSTYIKSAEVSGKVVTFTKGDGSTFTITTQDTDNNTTYATGTSTSAGLTKLYTGTGSNTDGTMTQSAIKSALDGKLNSSATAAAATKATKDSANQQITTTYIKNAEVSGKVVTFTKGDGSTFSIETQDTDNNTTYATGTSTSSGLTKLYTGTGSNTDGTMTQSAITNAIANGAVASATKDSGGNTINSTYIKNASVNGRTVTFTKGDGATFSITTQDSNTTYGTGTTAATGLTKLYDGTGANTDGTIRQKELTDILNAGIVNASVSGRTVTFTKNDGSTFSITTQDNNTTYGTGSSTSAGLTKLYTSTGTATDGTMTQNAIKSALDGKLNTGGTATAAAKDSGGNTINTTYIKNATVSGKVVTFTKGDGATFSITTQDTDNNTTYATGTSGTAGLTKLYTNTGTATDGTMTQAAIKSALDGKLDSGATAAAATKATNDSANQQINTTYIKNASASGRTVTFTKGDGATFSITTQDSNTTYGTGTSTSSGLTKLYAGTGANTDGTMTQSAIKSALDGKLNADATATAATKDGGGNVINTTYIKAASVSGKVVTFTKGDGSTFTITTQDTDNNTTYATGTSTSAGLTKLYTSTGTATDGTMTQSAIKSALDGKLNSSATAAAATKATNDSANQQINTTYIKNATVAGKVVTFTKGDGSTFSITTQDTDHNTTYATGTTAATGLTKLYAATGANTDGTIRQKELTDILNANITNASASGRTVTFTKADGSTFSITTQDNNTTYGTGTTAAAGLTKLYTTTGTNTDGTMTQNAIKSALDGKLGTGGTAAAATKDSGGNTINTTYIKNATVAGKVVTFTKGDGSTFSITTQDTDHNTTYATGTTAATGLTKLYAATGANTDGTIRQKELTDILNANIVNASVSGKVVTFTKGDGSTFTITTQDTDNNTTYATGTSTSAGLTKLYTGTGTNTDGTMTQKAIKSALDGKLGTGGTAAAATKATNDSANQQINTTYIKNASASGKTVTFTKGDGSTFSITTQDTNTTYGTGTTAATGLTKLYAATGSNTDGTIRQKELSDILNANITNASVSGRTVTFTKADGSTFSITTQDNNTTYGTGTTAATGLTKLYTTTGTATDGTMTQNAIKSALDGKLNSSATATAATKDSGGNTINTTYIKTASASGRTVTFTKGNGSTFSITTQDSNTTYGTGTTAAAGLTKLYDATGTATDGTMTQSAITSAITNGAVASATKDSADQQITTTYIKNATVSGKVVTFTKGDGSTFSITTQDTNTNTTYSTGTTATAGLTKLYTATGTNTDGTMTQSAIKSALDGKLNSSATAAAATKATKDSANQQITTTYIKNATVSGKVVTFTKGDGSTFSITTQDTDTNTTYSTGTSTSAGLTKLYTGTGSNTDGTMTQSAIKSALDGKLGTGGTAAAATKDSGGNTINTTYIKNASVSGKVVTFTKGDGSTFTITTQDTDNNTTYATGTTAATGLTKLYATTGTATDGTIRQKELSTLINGKLNSTATAAAATKDSGGNTINTTYIKNASVSGKVITFTKGDGSTFSITTQDTNTTYGTGTTATAGLTKLYTTTGTATDGTMTQKAIKSQLDSKLSTSGTAASAKVLNNSTSSNSLGTNVLIDFGDEG